jgi:SseB protein C-terminal domain/SseB protein N-terminal domain
MFEPENDIERLLMRASADPAVRPDFACTLMNTQVFVVLVSDGAKIAPGPDGHAVISAGVKLSMPTATRGEEKLIPFFSARSRAKAWFKGDHIVAPERTRDLFERSPNEHFILNPSSDYGKEFTPGEVKHLLAGHFDPGPQTITIEKPEQVLLAHPKETPVDLIEALGRELQTVKSVQGAWLMLAMRAGDQSWMLGVDHNGSWPEVRAAIGRAITGDVLGGHMLDALPLEGSSLASTLRTGIPITITAAKRGFLQKLFR